MRIFGISLSVVECVMSICIAEIITSFTGISYLRTSLYHLQRNVHEIGISEASGSTVCCSLQMPTCGYSVIRAEWDRVPDELRLECTSSHYLVASMIRLSRVHSRVVRSFRGLTVNSQRAASNSVFINHSPLTVGIHPSSGFTEFQWEVKRIHILRVSEVHRRSGSTECRVSLNGRRSLCSVSVARESCSTDFFNTLFSKVIQPVHIVR
jgi:hypothetical protein